MSRWDRWWLILLGMLAAASGMLSLAWQRWVAPGRRLIGDPFEAWVDEAWFPWAVVGAGLIIAACGLAWLISQLRRGRNRPAELHAAEGPPDAPVSVPSGSVNEAVTYQAEAAPGVISARSTVVSGDPPTVELSPLVSRGTDLNALLDQLDTEVGASLRGALARPEAQVIVRIRLDHRRAVIVEGGTLDDPTPTGEGTQPGSPHTDTVHSAASASATSSGTSTLA